MIDVATFLKSIESARGSRSDKEISRAAGLSGNAVAAMRAGKVPSLERAARVADVVGLELHLRRKGEAIDPLALHLCFLQQFMLAPGSGGPKEAETATSLVAKDYGRWLQVFLSVPPDQRQAVFDLCQQVLLDSGERLTASLESGSVDQAAQALAAATAATTERDGAENIAPGEGDEADQTGGAQSESGGDALTS